MKTSVAVTYDAIGNITGYNGKTLTWDGRRLETIGNYRYLYNDEGIRIAKYYMGELSLEYKVNGSQILSEHSNWSGWNRIFIYDETGSLIGFKFHDGSYADGVYDYYYYVKNLQGDVTKLYGADGTLYATYKYDAWGNHTVTYSNGGASIAAVNTNPIRYRSYYYDTESNLYYLNSRYYSQILKRFISPDGEMAGIGGDIIGNNLYIYCFNNPVMYIDPTGNWPNWSKFVEGALLTAIGVLTVAAVWASGGTCLPLVAAAYSALGTAGVVTAAVGLSEIAESFTDENPLKEAVGEDVYNGYKYASIAIVSMGPAIMDIGTSVSVCFVAGTLVETEEGSVPIEDIAVGVLVYAYDPETGETALKPVVETFVNETTELVHVFVGDEEIICTPEHPFYSPVKGWTAAVKLRAGDVLQLLNGEYVVVEQVQHEILEAPITVYNFEVADFHTYYVGKSAVLVHNTCGGNSSSKTALPKNGTKVNSSVALDMANDFLGPGYTEVSPSRFVSADGFRQVRMTNADILGLHGGGPHINFDRLYPNYKSVHIYIFDD